MFGNSSENDQLVHLQKSSRVWLADAFYSRGGEVTCLFGDVLVNIPSLAIYLFHASQEWSRCGVLLKHDKAPWSTEVCIVCSPSLPVCLPAMQIVSPP